MDNIHLTLKKLPTKEQNIWVMLSYPLMKLIYHIDLVQHYEFSPLQNVSDRLRTSRSLWASKTDGEEPNGREVVRFMFYLLFKLLGALTIAIPAPHPSRGGLNLQLGLLYLKQACLG
jgi:hypothetical protein